MSFPRYPRYAIANVPWLDQIPSHWDVQPLFSIAEKRKVPNTDMHETNLLSLSYGRIINKDINTDEGLLPESYKTYQIVEQGDIVLRPTDLQNDQTSLRSAQVRERGIITSAYLALQIRACNSRFLHYLLRAYDEMKVLYSLGGGLRQSLKFESIKRLPIILPSDREQRNVAEFLDYETAKIDALIKEQKRLIELLKEKRQAVISHAVTKGLDPNTPMKDSGVVWLGEVPAHWSVSALRHFAEIKGGIAIGKRYLPTEQLVEAAYLRVANVQDGYVDLTELKRVQVSKAEVDRYSLRRGDVLMNEGGDNDKLGRGTVWDAPVDNCLHQNHVFAIRCGRRLIPEWLALFSRSTSARAYFYLYSKQSTNLASISSSNVMSCYVPVPPVSEQRKVLDSTSKALRGIQALIEEANDAISLLDERRSALISAAVTGKIDVRNWQSQSDTTDELPMAAEEPATYEAREQ